MTLVTSVMKRFGFVRPTPRRSFQAGAVNRLTSNWITQPTNLDSALYGSLRSMRARSRQLARDNDYAKSFFGILGRNVIGPAGIALQSRLQTGEGTPKKSLNDRVEDAWRDWGRRGVCDVTGGLSWLDMQHLLLRTIARDGEVLIRKVKGDFSPQGNPYGFALQLIPADHLDEDFNQDDTGQGTSIRMSVEKNRWGRPVAYHLRTKNPAETLFGGAVHLDRRERVPAEEIEHVFLQEDVNQTRAQPWMYAAMLRLQMLGGYEEAEVVRARVDASKMGFYKTPTGEEFVGDDTDTSGNVIDEVEPGMVRQMPAGWEFQAFTPTSPSGQFPVFVKAMLRGIASGLNVSYNTLSSDLEGVNYSSIRQGVLDERDQYRVLQGWFIQHVCEPIFHEWLEMAILTGQIDVGVRENLSRKICSACLWQPRGWGWVDPRSDMEANCKAIRNGLKTRQSVLAEQGLDLDDVFHQLQHEQTLAKELGLTFEDETPAADTAQPGDETHEDVQDGNAVSQ